MRIFKCLLTVLFFITIKTYSQDIIVKTNGEILRGTILGTDYSAVKYTLDEKTQVISGIKEVKQFVWNGETYIIKTFFGKKKAEDRFVKIIETGKVNLYAIGGNNTAPAAEAPRVKVRPSIGIGMGTGGGMGGGVGGTISFGGGRRAEEPAQAGPSRTFYFIEKPGTGALSEVEIKNTENTKALLLQKLGDDADLAGRIRASEAFDGKLLIAFVKAYNDMHP